MKSRGHARTGIPAIARLVEIPKKTSKKKCVGCAMRWKVSKLRRFSEKPQRQLRRWVAAFMQAVGIPNAHISGLSLGAASSMWLAAKYPNRVKSLSLHSGWAKTDPFLKVVVEGWQVTAKALGSVPEMVILSIFPWCFTPQLYAARPEYIQSLAEFVRGRPAQPLAAFLQQSNAVIAHDVEAQLGQITAPTQISFGRHDAVTSTRFADRMKGAIRGSELLIFEECAHTAIYEKVEEFNQKTLAFLQRHAA